jgi:hypothetical protein
MACTAMQKTCLALLVSHEASLSALEVLQPVPKEVCPSNTDTHTCHQHCRRCQLAALTLSQQHQQNTTSNCNATR